MKLDKYTCDGQMNIFDFIKEPEPVKEALLPCDTCGHDVKGCCDYDYIANHDYCVLGDKWIPKTPEPVQELSERVGEWVKEHGDRVMFEDIKEGHYYIADYSTVSHEWYKIVFVKWVKDDSVGYVDAPKGVKGKWSWGNSYSALTRKQYINEPQTCGGKWYMLPSEGPDEAAGEPQKGVKESPRAADPEPRQLKSEQSKICQYSQHTCNKANLWEVADTLDDIKCPRTCCRICSVKSCGARCNGSEEPKRQQDTTDEYLKENPTCFYVFGHYLDRADGWHKVPEELPAFTTWQKVDVVVFGKKTGCSWMEHDKWEAKDWTFRTIDESRHTESIEILAWCLSDQEGG